MKPPECIPPLLRAGIDPADAHALRRAVDPATYTDADYGIEPDESEDESES